MLVYVGELVPDRYESSDPSSNDDQDIDELGRHGEFGRSRR